MGFGGIGAFSSFTPSFPMMQPFPIVAPAATPLYSPGYSQSVSAPTYMPSTVATGGSVQTSSAVVCSQYTTGLQYGTMADDPSLDQLCNVSPGSTSSS